MIMMPLGVIASAVGAIVGLIWNFWIIFWVGLVCLVLGIIFFGRGLAADQQDQAEQERAREDKGQT